MVCAAAQAIMEWMNNWKMQTAQLQRLADFDKSKSPLLLCA
jgi:hypothetical protein